MKKKKRTGLIIALAVLAAVVAGGTLAIPYLRKRNVSIYVQPVSYINNSWVLSNNSTSGTVLEAATQNVYLSLGDRVDEVYVSEGQRVEAGDPLFRYDIQTLELELEQKELDVEVAELSLTIARQTLSEYQAIVPRAAVTVTEPVYEPVEYAPSAAEQLPESVGGDGSSADPYRYEINEVTVVSASQINDWIYGGETVLFSWPGQDNQSMMVYPGSGQPASEEDSPGESAGSAVGTSSVGSADQIKTLPEPSEDEGVEVTYYWRVDENSVPVEYGTWYRIATRELFTPEVELPEIDVDSFSGPTYTADDKARMVRDQELVVRRAQNSLAQTQNAVDSARKKLEDATVRATLSGTVARIGDPSGLTQDGSPFCTVAGDAGVTVQGFLSELELGKRRVGDRLTVTSWMSGASTEAQITEISDFPTDTQQWSNGNPNVSFYEYRAFMENAAGFEVGESVGITPYSEDADNAIVLSSVYVRTEDGETYVMIDDGSGRLKKQPVTVTPTTESGYLQVIEGLSNEDLIAFPYGDGHVEGTRTTEEYQYSIF